MDEYLRLAFSQRRIKQILNLIFVSTIASCIFESLFFDYTIIDVKQYGQIYAFFIYGHFIIPFAIFYSIWLVTIGLTMLLFQLPNVYITKRFGEKIRDFLLWYYTSNASTSNSKSVLPKSKSMDWIYKSARQGSMEEGNLIRRTMQSHRSLESDYTLILRGFIAMTIYFNQLDYFGWLTYALCIFILLFTWLLQIVKYQFSEVFPEIIMSGKNKPEESLPPQENT
jgi:hypothetical protein